MNELCLRPNPYPGKLIVFEGTDGAGKTTMIRMAADCLQNEYGLEVLCEKQPTDLSRKTRLFQKMMYCENHEEIDYRAVQLLTMSDRIQHSHETIEPSLAAGKTVLCDRYIYTSLANMLARGYRDENWFFEASRPILKPDLAFLAYAEPWLAIRRIRSRPAERDRHLNEELLSSVAREFLRMRDVAEFEVLETDRRPDETFVRVRRRLETLMEKKNEKGRF